MKRIIITQSNYIPWKGYFNSINLCDVFVIYDDMQYTRRDWRNRNLIKTSHGLKWLTIPVDVKGKYLQKINETRISDKTWMENHLNLLRQNYKDSPCYKEVIYWIEKLYCNCKFEYLTEVNQYFIENINLYLGIKVKILRSEQFQLVEDKTERLVNICKDLNGTDYFSGPTSKAYLDESKFRNEGINVHYFDYSNYPEYTQLYEGFEHGVSILDLIFNVGENAKNYMLSIK